MQQTVENAMSTIVRRSVPLTGAGRTDSGVHARCMYAHFDLDRHELADRHKFLLSLNRLCGPNISLQEILDVHPEAHARFDATLRTYKYFVTFEKSPFINSISWHSPGHLDAGKMNEAASLLLKTSDFTSFAKLHSDAKTNICQVKEAKWTPIAEMSSSGISFPCDGLVFTISADRFLRNMVRAIVGTLVDVGRGKMTVDEFSEIIELRDRCSAGTSMPPQALFLWDIEYPYLLPSNNSF